MSLLLNLTQFNKYLSLEPITFHVLRSYRILEFSYFELKVDFSFLSATVRRFELFYAFVHYFVAKSFLPVF